MKRLLVVGLCGLVLGACGTDTNEEVETSTSSQQSTSESVEIIESSVTVESEPEESIISSTTLDTDRSTYVIKEVEQIQSKYDDTQILAITIDYTNKTDKPKSSWMAWVSDMVAEQETDVTVEGLNGGMGQIPDDYKPEATELTTVDIKPGATVETVITHEILYPGSPVKIMNRGSMGENGDEFYLEVPTE